MSLFHSNSFLFKGTGVALVTPFQQNGAIDFKALARILDYTRDGGVDYYVVLGTTGEPATLNKEEKIKIFEFVAEYNQGRLPLVAGIGGNNTQETVQTISDFPLGSYSGILSVSPYYNKPSQEGIYQHFKAISESTTLPIILYNVPGRTGTNIWAETTLKLASDFKNIIGIKEASGQFDQFTEIMAGKPSSFQLISGDDGIAVPMISIGAVGLISVLANSHPKECSVMIRSALNQDFEKAGNDHIAMSKWISVLFKESNPTGVKAIMEEIGVCGSRVRLPLIQGSRELLHEIKGLLINEKKLLKTTNS